MGKTFDIAIVGGGISGLYAAWRLRQAWHCPDSRKSLVKKLGKENENGEEKGTLNVVILEKDPIRLGGRLRSAELPFPGGSVVAEVGAMRFTTRHRLLRRLLQDLDIRTVPFEGPGFTTRYFLRGKHFGEADIRNNDKENFPYNLEKKEQCKSPTDLLSDVLELTLRDLSLDDDATPETLRVLEKLRGERSREELKHWEWEEIRNHGLLTGRVPLKNIGMWNLVHHFLSADAAHFVEDGFGYESIIGNWNISDAIPWFISDFSPSQTYETVVGSFSHLVERLRQEIEEPKKENPIFKCTVLLNARVKGVSQTKEKLLELTVKKQDTRYKHGYDQEKLAAKIVILALPKLPLEQLKLKDFMSQPAAPGSEKPERRWRTQLRMVRDHRLVKIVQGYRNAWWRKQDDLKGAGGRIFTDLPIRQLYYFDREWLEERGRYRYYDNGKLEKDANGDVEKAAKGKPADRTPEIQGMVVAYLDGHYASFWRFIPAVILELERRRRFGADVKSIEGIEEEKRGVFGDRIWGWIEPKEELRQAIAKRVKKGEKWSDEESARHLYFYWQGLFERASTKMHLVLKQLHSFSRDPKDRIHVPTPVAGAYAFWENFGEHFEAGWHTWEPGVDSTLAMKYMVQPFKNQEVYVCGEAYSSEQGWIEGPLKSVEMVMDRLGVMLPGEKLAPKASEEKKESERIRDYVGLPPREFQAPPKYARVMIPGNQCLVFISGQIGFDPDPWSYDPPPPFDKQATKVLERLDEILKSAGESPRRLVMVRVFLESMAHYHEFNEIYRHELKKMGLEPPARTAVAVKALPFDALVEVEAVGLVGATTDGSQK